MRNYVGAVGGALKTARQLLKVEKLVAVFGDPLFDPAPGSASKQQRKGGGSLHQVGPGSTADGLEPEKTHTIAYCTMCSVFKSL